jgi:hypothetical protein
MSWRVYRLMQAQAPLDAAATWIQALAARPGPAHAGFFETAVDASRHVLTVYWHGAVPGNVQRLISGLRAKVTIRVVKTRYSLAALDRGVLAAIRAGRGVTSGYPMTDGGGIVLGVHTASTRVAASVTDALRSRLGIPVTATLVGVDQLQTCDIVGRVINDPVRAGSRCDDYENFWGGDVIQSQYVGCTGGFGVHDSSGGEYLLTAAHCAFTGSAYVNGIAFHNGQDSAHSQFVGYITDVPGPHDVAVIPTGTGAQYYDGPGIFNGDTTRTKFVSGQRATSLGDTLCESGAFGGVLCGFTVQQLHYYDVDCQVLPCQTWTDMAVASSGSGNFTVSGDSGGPWFSLNGSTHVWAKGIQHGLTFDINGNPTGEVFTPITVATNDMGVTVNTG